MHLRPRADKRRSSAPLRPSPLELRVQTTPARPVAILDSAMLDRALDRAEPAAGVAVDLGAHRGRVFYGLGPAVLGDAPPSKCLFAHDGSLFHWVSAISDLRLLKK